MGFLKNRKIWLAVLLGAILMASSGVFASSLLYHAVSGSWRYKMTVSVETPEGIKTGSVVREVDVEKRTSIFSEKSEHTDVKVKGEAAVVDLGKRGVLFALMESEILGVDYNYDVVFKAFPSDKPGLTPEGIRYYNSLKSGKTVLHPVLYPRFVRFGDLSDPGTVESVYDIGLCREKFSNGNCMEWDPFVNGNTMKDHLYIKRDRFEELFGVGVKIKEVTIEMTDDPVTWGISKWLPWLPEYYNKRFDGRTLSSISAENRVANSLASGAFSAGGNVK